MRYTQLTSLFILVLSVLCLSYPAYAWKMEAGKVTLAATSSLNQLESHLFQQIYDVPPIVIALPTSAGSNPGSIRISNVTTSGFRMSPVEPKSEDGPHAAMTVSYIAIEPGVHTFPDGETIEAGTITTDKMQFNGNPNGRKEWATLNYANTFSAPVLLASIQTTANEPALNPRLPSHPWLTVAVDNITNTRANISLERSELYDRITGSNFQFDNLSTSETIGYVVMNRNLSGNFRASGNLLVNFESVYSSNSVQGWTNGCNSINFTGSYSAAPIAVATKSSRNEADGGWLRECAVNSNRIQLTIDEDTDQDNERSHASEDASVLVFSNTFFYDSNAATSLNTSSSLMLEANSATLSANSFTTIQFDQVYDYPPAVFLLGDNQNPEPSSARIRNVTTQSFQVVPLEPDSTVADAADQQTSVNYLAISKGEHRFPDGIKIEIGPTVPPDEIINFQSKRISGSSWFNFSFGSAFSSTPALLSQIQTMHSETGHVPGTRSRPWMTMAISNVSVTGGLLALERAETNTGTISAAEEIAFVAVESGIISDFKDVQGNTISAEAQTTPNNLAGSLACDSYSFLQSYPAAPLVIGSQTSRNGGDGGWLRRCSTSTTQVSLKIEEDWALDRDNSHTNETAGLLAFSEPFHADFSLVANYQLEGPNWSGTAGEVMDSSNSALHGQAYGDARPFPGQVCNGASFDGDRDYIAIPDNPALDISDELTVMAWINPRALPASDLKTIVSKDTNFEFHLDTTGRVFWWWNNATGGTRSFDSNASTVSVGNWHHVAITYSKSAGQQKIVIDGVEANSQSYNNESLINNNLPMYIGTDDAFPSRDFDGRIDEVKVFKRALPIAAIQKYAAESRPCASCILGRFDITQPTYTLACPDTRAEIEITARCVDGTIKTDYAGTINLSGPAGSAFFDAASAGNPINALSYNFADSGSKKTYLYFNNEQADVKVTVEDVPASVASTATSGTSFKAFGFNITRQPDHFVCADSTNMTMVAWGKVDNSPGGACAALTGFDGNKTLDAWFTATLDDDATQELVSDALTISSTAILHQNNTADNNLSLNFVNGAADFSIRYPNSAKIQNLNFRYDSAPYDGSVFSAMASTTTPFIIKPNNFLLTATSGGNNINGNSSGSAFTHKAGEAFALSLTAQCSDGTTASDYAPNSTNSLMTYLQRTGPLGGSSVDGEMPISASRILTSNTNATVNWQSANLAPASFTNGSYLYEDASYSEVGLTRLHLKDQSYFGEEIPQTAIDIGRFIPDHFEVTVNSGSLAHFCSPAAAAAFSYTGQTIAYASLPELLIQARNTNNTVTQNYTEAGFLKLTPVNISRFFPTEDSSRFGADGINKLTFSSDKFVPSAFSTASGGLIRYTFDSADSFTYNKNANAQVAPFNSGIKVEINDVLDSDNVGSNAEPYEVLPTPVELRFGRWHLENAFGPETSNLGIPMQIQYWAGANFQTNTSDTCSAYDASNLIDTESLSGGSTSASGSGLVSVGKVPLGSEIMLSAPGANNVGSVALEYQADSWLQYDWDNNPATADTHPTATAMFGQYRGHDRIIYWREVND